MDQSQHTKSGLFAWIIISRRITDWDKKRKHAKTNEIHLLTNFHNFFSLSFNFTRDLKRSYNLETKKRFLNITSILKVNPSRLNQMLRADFCLNIQNKQFWLTNKSLRALLYLRYERISTISIFEKTFPLLYPFFINPVNLPVLPVYPT